MRGSLLRVLDRDRQRFQLHALLRDQLRARAGEDGLAELQERHAAALEDLFKDWETRWQECRECLEEIIPAADSCGKREESGRQTWKLIGSYSTAERIGETDAAHRILQQEEAFWTERDDREARMRLQRSYGNQAMILYRWGRLEEAMALHKKEEAICMELGDKDGLQASYGNQALILKHGGGWRRRWTLHKKQEAICLELGNKDGLQVQLWQPGADPPGSGGVWRRRWHLHRKQEAICLELGNKNSLQIELRQPGGNPQ